MVLNIGKAHISKSLINLFSSVKGLLSCPRPKRFKTDDGNGKFVWLDGHDGW